MFGQYDHWGWGMMGGGFIFMILFWFLIVIGTIYLIKVVFVKDSDSGATDKAMNILREKYAKGEISEKEFEKKKRILKN